MYATETRNMNSTILRQLWSAVEHTQSSILLRLSDSELVSHLLAELGNQQPLDREAIANVSTYLRGKTSLIRDLAQSRSF
ncbi:MAG: hypothetical protein CLLPBCKN_000569 [Chroococcidiopsis cubana SAG 39.79]|jgi:hypothetical protein|uniref:Uncharacterized protein n=1 Tax=Chroococcidiopsis thermalis (strain PCC 7203) TaxID=251229 RepID=K9U2A4_CHRTP|nr:MULTISPECIES: hypothetical protein [Chroococcidiopsis]AFY88965.1 hypothetical protein Chro_3507 [Chroococcidiopsis thermalis PCC 7203]MDZ4871181.1 hypothetical protein [Chroococcidiopsis cubana SAG 39.79]PSB66393.1 hypothetical protein C7B79_01295 [Chroococcidiopsis cubana CCALA 043]URD48286.1 hypothetical protein M5J74_18295 [Chroococcidiopsis sp. CCNUC1]